MWFYKVNVINKLNINKTTVTAVTKKVNGGSNGLSDRKAIYKRAKKRIKYLN